MNDRATIKRTVRTNMRGTWGTPLVVLIVYLLLSLVIGSFSYERGNSGLSIGIPNLSGSPNIWSFVNGSDGSQLRLYGLLPLFSPALSFILNVLVLIPLNVSVGGFFLMYYRLQNPTVGRMFDCFSNSVSYINSLAAMLWRILFVFLWSIPLVIPGIVKSYAYFFIPYIVAENPGIGARKAMKTSMKLTYGYKGALFVLDLSFIGWHILSALTLGILSVWIRPYIETTYAAYYDELKDLALARGTASPLDFMPD